MANKLIAYAMHFASFLIENGVEAKRIILFGSVAGGESDKESDVDIFVDMKKSEEKRALGILGNFEKTFGEKWKLKGVNNQLSLTVGALDSKEWEDLKRTIQSRGIVLYGHYSETPKNIQPYILFGLDFRSIKRAQKVGLWRKIYGYEQKVGSKRYKSKGVLEQLGGVKIAKGVALIPSWRSHEFKDFLKYNRIRYSNVELWSDQFGAGRRAPPTIRAPQI